MKLEKAKARDILDQPVSFRLSKQGFGKLEALAKVLKKTKSHVIEDIIEQAYEAARRQFPSEMKKL